MAAKQLAQKCGTGCGAIIAFMQDVDLPGVIDLKQSSRGSSGSSSAGTESLYDDNDVRKD